MAISILSEKETAKTAEKTPTKINRLFPLLSFRGLTIIQDTYFSFNKYGIIEV